MPSPTYADITIDLDPLDDNSFLVEVRAPDGAEARAVFIPPSGAHIANLLARFAEDQLDAAGAATLGAALYEALLIAKTRELFARGLSYAEQHNARPRLLLTIRHSAYAAAGLPWELLHDTDGASLLRRGLAVVRRTPLDWATPPPLIASRLRLLLTGAPTEPLFAIEQEFAAVQSALENVADRVELVVEEQLTPTILQRRLREGFHAWHHVGHAHPDGSLVLLDENGDPFPVTPTQVAGMLGGGDLRLAVFSACDSGRFDETGGLVAALLSAGVPTTIAMQRKVTADTTRTFADELYRALAEGWSVSAAVDEGRRAVLAANAARPDWGIPAIYSRTPDDALFARPAPAQTHDHFGAPVLTAETIATGQALLEQLPIADDQPIPMPARFPLNQRMPMSANPLFVGRDDDLRILARQLKPQGGAVAVTTGIGGIGKTQLAAEFAHRYGRYFAGGVFWISFADPQGIAGQIAAYGGPGALELFRDDDDLTLDERCAKVQAQWASDLPRLVIFDNCDDAGGADPQSRSAEQLLRQWKPGGGCRVLVTSRRANWSPTLGVTMHDIDTLARPASITLLQSLAPELETTDADTIADLLGDLPLALYLAGNFLRVYLGRATTVDAFIARLRSSNLLTHPALQGRGTTDMPTERDAHVAKAFALSVERLNPENNIDALAQKLLMRAALFAPGEPFPQEVLMATVLSKATDEDTQFLASDALQRLLDLGLLEAESSDTLHIHRLIAAYAQQTIPDGVALNAVEDTLTNAGNERVNNVYPSAIMPIVTHLRYAFARADGRSDVRTANLADALASAEVLLVNYSVARLLYERALAIAEQVLGPTHPNTASSLNNLATLLDRQGEYTAARSLYERALAIREQVLGPTHPDTASSLNNLASLLYRQGDYTAARPLYQRAQAIWEQVLGPTHPDTATSLNNLALLLRSQGDYTAAKPLVERALAIREQVLGPTHPDTATSLNNLALLLRSQGDYTAARPLYERALAIREQVLGPTHPDTATSLNNLAYLLNRQGDYAAARPLYERALAIREQVLGPTHPHTATSLNNLALLLRNQGDYVAAKPLYERALAINEQVLGPTHPHTATSLNNLALLLESQGEYAAARLLYERALAINEQVLGPTHPATITIKNNLTSLLQAQNE